MITIKLIIKARYRPI